MMPSVRIAFLVLVLWLPACQCPPQHTDLAANEWIRSDLYFGLTRRDSSAISDADFQGFVDEVITPTFPQGFTITAATGQYLDSGKVLHKEPSRVLTVLYQKNDAPVIAGNLQSIAASYCQQFDQESVLETSSPARAKFLSAPAAK